MNRASAPGSLPWTEQATPPPGDAYRLVLDDGRSAALLVYATQGRSGTKRTLFQLNGGWDPMP